MDNFYLFALDHMTDGLMYHINAMNSKNEWPAPDSQNVGTTYCRSVGLKVEPLANPLDEPSNFGQKTKNHCYVRTRTRHVILNIVRLSLIFGRLCMIATTTIWSAAEQLENLNFKISELKLPFNCLDEISTRIRIVNDSFCFRTVVLKFSDQLPCDRWVSTSSGSSQ